MKDGQAFLILLNNKILVSNEDLEIKTEFLKKNIGKVAKSKTSAPQAFNMVTEDMIFEPLKDKEFEIKRLIIECKVERGELIIDIHIYILRKKF